MSLLIAPRVPLVPFSFLDRFLLEESAKLLLPSREGMYIRACFPENESERAAFLLRPCGAADLGIDACVFPRAPLRVLPLAELSPLAVNRAVFHSDPCRRPFAGSRSGVLLTPDSRYVSRNVSIT